MHNLKLKKTAIALCMALMPVSIFAAGLGKLNVMSGIGEPLKADIELISATPEELSSITAAIASEEAYATQGIEKPASHNTIKVETAKNAAGAPILKLKSTQPITEPFLDMLIQVDWASGRLLREYTVLLDPPGYTGEAADTNTTQAPMVTGTSQTERMADKPAANDSMTGEIPASTAKKTGKKSKKAKPVLADESAVASEPLGPEYTTERGDTLAKIARDMKPEGVSLEQMLVGLYDANQDAFQGKNMNRLKVGQIIRPPSEAALNAIARKQAAREIKVQTANWNAYKNKLAGIVAADPSTSAESNEQAAGGKITSAAVDKSMPAADGPKDVVKLSAGDAATTKAGAGNTKALNEKIAALQEEATAREKSVAEAQDRTAALEKQIADMKKLLDMKNGAMLDLQKQAQAQLEADKKKATTDTNSGAAPVKTPDMAKEAPEKPVEPAPVPVVEAPKPQAEADKPAAKPVAEAPKPAAPVTPEAPKEAAKPVAPVPEPIAEAGFLDGILGGLGDLGLPALGGLGALGLIGGGWMFLRKKREKSLADFEQGIMTSGGLKANTVFGNTGSANVDTGDTSFLSDFSQGASDGMIDTNDVDPIAEAEVYMAYGREAQAEEILKDAIAKEPKRYELHLKLLEMYVASNNASAFETISGELYTSLGAEDPTWAKVADMGAKLEPNNPLYQRGGSPVGLASKSVVAVATAAVASASSVDVSDKLDASDFSDSPLASEQDLEFAMTQDFAPTGTIKTNEFEQETIIAPLVAASAESAPTMTQTSAAESAVLSAAADNAGALDFDMGELGAFNTPTAAIAESKSFSSTMPSLDVPTFEAPSFMPEKVSDVADKLEELTTETFEFPQVEEMASANMLDMSNASTIMQTPASDGDFNFDVEPTAGDVPSFMTDETVATNTLDLSGIDLDLNDTNTFNADASSLTASADEPIQVETKLELITAYLEMDDKDGAKELLAEVMNEGGATQRKRAEAILATLA